MRVLISITPQMYRQAIAFSIHRQRPGLDVKISSPEAVEGELADFRPHLLIHNDNDGLVPEAVGGGLCRIEGQYSDGMDAQVSAGGEFSTVRDMSTEDLLRVVDQTTLLAERGIGQS